MTEERGVLGNLPNSRPGRRSAKRDEAAGRTTAAKGGDSADGVGVMHDMGAERRHEPSTTPGDPVGAAVRGAAGLAKTGVKVAGAVTHELIRRLPRR